MPGWQLKRKENIRKEENNNNKKTTDYIISYVLYLFLSFIDLQLVIDLLIDLRPIC